MSVIYRDGIRFVQTLIGVTRGQVDGSVAFLSPGGRGTDTAQIAGVVCGRRYDRNRFDKYSRSEPATGIASSEAVVRCGVARPISRGQLGILPARR